MLIPYSRDMCNNDVANQGGLGSHFHMWYPISEVGYVFGVDLMRGLVVNMGGANTRVRVEGIFV